MAKYIEKEDAYRTLSNYYHHSTDNQHMALREALDRVPAADVMERKTGKWIHDTLGEIKMPIVKCSECGLIEPWFDVEGMGFALHGQKYANFCPDCGAQMEGAEKDV